MSANRVTVATFRSPSAAERARDALRAAGIEAWLGDDAEEEDVETSSALQLQVTEKDRVAALEILGTATRPTR